MPYKNIIGVDLGGTKISVGMVNGHSVTHTFTTETPRQETQEEVIQQLINAIEKVCHTKYDAIGIGVPSVVDSKLGIVYNVTAIPSWEKVPLKDILEKHFKVPVNVNNDSNCFALGEKYFGAGKEYSNFVGITLGTGLGTGVIINNKLYCGANTGAGEIGCIPYLDGIVENYCASNYFKELGTSGKLVYEKALKGEPVALTTFNDFGKHISVAIKMILYSYDPEMIVIGGSISNAYDFFIDSVKKHLEDFPYKNVLENLNIKKSQLTNAAVLGAAALVYDFEK